MTLIRVLQIDNFRAIEKLRVYRQRSGQMIHQGLRLK